MTGSEFVDFLGWFAGSVWVAAAVWFRFVRLNPVRPGYAGALFMIGCSIILGSSALVISGRPSVVQLLGLIANAILLFLGIAVWLWTGRHEDLVCSPTEP